MKKLGIGCFGLIMLIAIFAAVSTSQSGPRVTTQGAVRLAPTVSQPSPTARSLPVTPAPATAAPTLLVNPTSPVVSPTVPPATATSTPVLTPIPWANTVKELAGLKLPKLSQPDGYTFWWPADLTGRPIGEAVTLTGKVYNLTPEGKRPMFAFDASEDPLGSKPFLVVDGQLLHRLYPDEAVDIFGVYVGRVTAADRWGVNKDMPVVQAHQIK